MKSPSKAKKFLKWLAIGFAVFLSIVFWCVLFYFFAAALLIDNTVPSVTGRDGAFQIDSQTILDSFDHDKTGVFIPRTLKDYFLQMETDPVVPQVEWSQADYYRIAQVVHEMVRNETLEGWDVNTMLFHVDCEDAGYGPQYGSFKFSKMVTIDWMDGRFESKIYINPSINYIRWVESDIHPTSLENRAIDLEKIKIPVEEALKIAEQNGGKTARLGVDNDCGINLDVVSSDDSNGVSPYQWKVDYRASKNGDIESVFQLYIDTLTGEYK